MSDVLNVAKKKRTTTLRLKFMTVSLETAFPPLRGCSHIMQRALAAVYRHNLICHVSKSTSYRAKEYLDDYHCNDYRGLTQSFLPSFIPNFFLIEQVLRQRDGNANNEK